MIISLKWGPTVIMVVAPIGTRERDSNKMAVPLGTSKGKVLWGMEIMLHK